MSSTTRSSSTTDLLAPRRPFGERIRERFAAHEVTGWNGDATTLVVITGLLLVIGLVMSFSASVVDAAESGDAFGILRRQVMWAAIGIPVFVVVARLRPRAWRPLSWVLLVVSMVGLVLVVVPGVGITRGGSTRWLGFGPVVAQPSELVKLALVLWLADVTARKRSLRPDGRLPVRHLLVPALPVLAVVGVLVMAQPDMGTTLLIAVIVAILLFAEGLPLRLMGAAAGLAGVLAAVGAIVAPYRLARINGWLHPEAAPTGEGFQLLQSLYALGNGGWTGVGVGSSRGKWNFIPNPETDFVFSIIGEELGLVGALVVLGLFALLLVVGLRVARQAQGFSRTVAFTITGWLVGQAMINVATVIGVLPITGMTLPLVSAGGSSLVSTLVALGILVAIARDVDDPRPQR